MTDVAKLAEQARIDIEAVSSLTDPMHAAEYRQEMEGIIEALVALVEEQAAEIELLEQERRPVPTDEGGPGKEDSYWLRAKLRGAVTHLRDIEDYYRTLGGLPEGFNMIRADRARSLYEQISDDFINGRISVPTLRERAERAEAERDALREALRQAGDALHDAAWIMEGAQTEPPLPPPVVLVLPQTKRVEALVRAALAAGGSDE